MSTSLSASDLIASHLIVADVLPLEGFGSSVAWHCSDDNTASAHKKYHETAVLSTLLTDAWYGTRQQLEIIVRGHGKRRL